MTNLRAIALDPGITTGIAYLTQLSPASRTGFDYTNLCKDSLHITEERLSVYELYQLLEELRPWQIICEDFEYRSWEKSVELFSVQLIGVVNLYAQRAAQCQFPVELKMQSAAVGKGHYKDSKKIKDLNLWVPGKPHGMDALRHMLHWLTFGGGYRYKEQVNELGIGIK